MILDRVFGKPSVKLLVHAFIFTSGTPALIYQLSWQRVLFRLFGVNMESVTIVVAAFMLGLGIGSLIGSWLANRNLSPLLLISLIESGVGLFGIFSLRLFLAADPLINNLPLAGQISAALILLFVPTSLMGMTLPLLVGYFITRSSNVGLSTGNLYYVNTLGAVVGCVVAAFMLFPWIGLQHSVWIAATVNPVIGIAALTFFFGEENQTTTEHQKAEADWPNPLKMPISFGTGVSLSFAAGFISLSYEIFLIRLANYQTGSLTTATTVTLAVFLLGVASGARIASEQCGRSLSAGELSTKVVGYLAIPL